MVQNNHITSTLLRWLVLSYRALGCTANLKTYDMNKICINLWQETVEVMVSFTHNSHYHLYHRKYRSLCLFGIRLDITLCLPVCLAVVLSHCVHCLPLKQIGVFSGVTVVSLDWFHMFRLAIIFCSKLLYNFPEQPYWESSQGHRGDGPPSSGGSCRGEGYSLPWGCRPACCTPTV